MARRANWKGQLKIDQLLCPVALFTAASTSDRVSFNLINRETGNRLNREFVDGDTGKSVPRENQVKGYEVSSGTYLSFDEAEIAAAIPESDKTLNVTRFVKCDEIDDVYLDRPYYLAPVGDSDGFVLVREGMKSENVAAIAETVLFRRARQVLIRADDDGLIATTLNFEYEVRAAAEAFADLGTFKFDQEMLDLAQHIIDTKMGSFDPAGFDDRYDAALADLIKAKIEGKPLKKRAAPKTAEVIDLKEALRKSANLGRVGQAATKAIKGKAKSGAASGTKSRKKGWLIMGQSLETYRRKRDFTLTNEPRGKSSRTKRELFVVQKHDARRLHYDFRLEMDGVLKSWAVTRGPSLVPGEKRLAVHVEDHPLEYADFEGTIPKGEYGGGTVIVWDTGRWKSTADAHQQYKKGHLEFELTGEKLKGRWHLIRMHGKPDEKRENWLLIKGEDEFSRNPGELDILVEMPKSVKTGRAIADVEHEAPGWSSKTGSINKKSNAQGDGGGANIKNAKKRPMPSFVKPELATLVSVAPDGNRWLHEIKFDGYRIQAHIAGGKVALYSRGGLDWTEKFGQQIARDLVGTSVNEAIFDGEIVVESQSGLSDFSALQEDLREGRSDRFVYYLFDLLHVDGKDLRQTPLVERKTLLEKLISASSSTLRFSEAFDADGAAVLKNACGLGLEGIVSKLREASYRSGRSNDWRKSKCIGRQEFVIAGYVPSTVTRAAIGSLLLGVQDKKGLVPVGRVGTGFSVRIAKELYKRLQAMRQGGSPFAVPLTADERRGAKFVTPLLVAEIEFRAWTADKRLRHASFRGVRDDKAAKDVIWEKQTMSPRISSNGPEEIDVKLTHPDRVYWPGEGVTKQGLADYYSAIWSSIEPFIVNRPLALLRCPTGIDGEHFFQRHAWKGLNEHIIEVQDPENKEEEPYISIRDFNGLIGLVQAATLEIHPWGSTLKNWELPDTLTMDLDPGEGVPWSRVIEAAIETKERLEKLGLKTFVKTSGGKGLHVVAPLKPKVDWDALKSFTKAIADQMAADSPDRYVSTISKAKRKGKILIDYLRNQRGMTAVAPYSPRARPGAAVSMPLGWDEVTSAIGPAHFTIVNTPNRLAALNSDPWQDFRSAETPLPKLKK